MSIKIESTMKEEGYQDTEIRDFVSTLMQACMLLDTLGQLQAMAGALGMQERAGYTFEIHAGLENYVKQIKYNAGLRWPQGQARELG